MMTPQEHANLMLAKWQEYRQQGYSVRERCQLLDDPEAGIYYELLMQLIREEMAYE